MIKAIMELATAVLPYVKSQKIIVILVITSVIGIAAVIFKELDMREYFIRRSSYMISWYCSRLDESQRVLVREEVNRQSEHTIKIYCEGDRTRARVRGQKQ